MAADNLTIGQDILQPKQTPLFSGTPGASANFLGWCK